MGPRVLGSRVIEALRSFEFPVNGWSRTRRQFDGVRCYAGADEFAGFFATTRVLVCMLPLTPQIRGIVNAAHRCQLEPAGCLINLARGGLVVGDDLLAALDCGQLTAAVLDVMQEEPLSVAHRLWLHPAVTLTAHVAGITTRDETIAQWSRRYKPWRRGKPRRVGRPPT